jgi:hypothetical protein
MMMAEDSRRMALDAMLGEYSSLRTESVQAITNRVTIMSFTFGALSVIVAGLFVTTAARVLVGVIALVLIPQIAKAGALVWLGEYERSQRAGRWISHLEAQINEVVGRPATVGWESHLRGDKPKPAHMTYPYVASVVFMLGAGYAGDIYGFYLLAGQLSLKGIVNGLGVVLLCLWEGGFLWFVWRTWSAARRGTEPVERVHPRRNIGGNMEPS